MWYLCMILSYASQAFGLYSFNQALRWFDLWCRALLDRHGQSESHHQRQGLARASWSTYLEGAPHVLLLVPILFASTNQWETMCPQALLRQEWQSQGRICCQARAWSRQGDCLGLPQQTASSPWLPVDVGVPGWASVSSLLSFRWEGPIQQSTCPSRRRWTGCRMGLHHQQRWERQGELEADALDPSPHPKRRFSDPWLEREVGSESSWLSC